MGIYTFTQLVLGTSQRWLHSQTPHYTGAGRGGGGGKSSKSKRFLNPRLLKIIQMHTASNVLLKALSLVALGVLSPQLWF